MLALFGADEGSEIEVLPKEGVRVRKRPPAGPTEVMSEVKLRRGQEYFRDAVLNNFGGRCGVTELNGQIQGLRQKDEGGRQWAWALGCRRWNCGAGACDEEGMLEIDSTSSR